MKLCISTRRDKVKENEKVLKSLIDCKEEFVAQIKETEPFYKGGFYADGNKVKMQMFRIVNKTESPESALRESTCLPYYKCWCNDSIKFCDYIEQIEKDFIDFFPNDLIIKVEKLLDLVKPLKNMSDFIEMKQLKEFEFLMQNIQLPDRIELPVTFFLNEYKLIEILEKLEEVIMYIENETGKSLRERDIKFFNERNVSPIIGDLYK